MARVRELLLYVQIRYDTAGNNGMVGWWSDGLGMYCNRAVTYTLYVAHEGRWAYFLIVCMALQTCCTVAYCIVPHAVSIPYSVVMSS